MFTLKEILGDIVTQAYGTDCNPAYHRFYVEMANKNSKTYHGLYDTRNRKITIYNTYRENQAIVCTTIHELAHHVDFCDRKTTDHQKEFYEVYEKLLFAAMDMGIVSKEKFLLTTKDASDSEKIRKMMERYVPHEILYKKDAVTLSLSNSYAHRQYLQSLEFSYNGNTKAWEKEFESIEEMDAFCKEMKPLDGVKMDVFGSKDLHFEGSILLIAQGDTYAYKDKLRAAGFRYTKVGRNQAWVFHAKSSDDVVYIKAQFPELQFIQK